jgi:HK97 gp10 family phage protein
VPSNEITVTITGLDEVEQSLQNLSQKLARSVVRRALRPAGEVLRAEAELLAPRATGFLAEHVGEKVTTSVREEEGRVTVGPEKNAFYGSFAELGTKNQAPRPWLRPAFESKKDEAVEVAVENLKEMVTEALTR